MDTTQTLVDTLARHYDELIAHVRGHIARRGGDHSGARDVVHELCVHLAQAPPGLPPTPVRAPLAFLRHVARCRATDLHRVEAARRRWLDHTAELPEPACDRAQALDPARIAEGRQDVQALAAAIEALPPRCREVFVLNKVHGLPQAEVAQRLGISVKAVEKHLRLGLAACRRSGLGVLAAAVVAAGILWLDPAYRRETHVSAIGERKTVTLADGSHLTLDTASAVDVAWHLGARRSRVRQGQVQFEVAAAAPAPFGRPFEVVAGPSRIRVLGTAFGVRLDGGTATVTVTSGRVQVGHAGPGGDRTGPVRVLGAGEQVRDTAQTPGRVQRVDPAAADAWQHGRLAFDRTPLAAALAEVQRYRAAPIRLHERAAGPGIAGLQLSGSFDTTRTDALLDLLPRVLPVVVVRQPDGSVDVRAR